MSNALVFDRTVKMMEDRLSLNSVNQKLISSNLANINTPGYKAREVSFDNALRESLQEQVLQMVRSKGSHVGSDGPGQTVASPPIIETGQVDLDNEMVKLAKNSIEYQYMVNMLNKKFTMLKMAITEGGS